MEILKLQGVRTVYGCVTIPNPGSERLHERMGFERIGAFHNTGYKNGKWLDVVWYEKQIAPYDVEPKPVIPVGEIGEDRLEEIIRAGR